MGKLAAVVVVAFLAYVLYVPLPRGWKDEREHRIFATFLTNIYRITDNYFLNAILKMLGHDRWYMYRLFMEAGKLKYVDGVTVTNETWNGIKVYIFTPDGVETGKRPGVVFFHGGGWTLMKPEPYGELCGQMAKQVNAVVISPDFRTAPEHPFPAAYNDCLMVVKHFINNADRFKVDINKIALTGDSSGGNLAAAISLELENKIHSQYLLYPALQLTNYHLPNLVYHKYDAMLSESLINRLKMSYLGFDKDERMSSIILNHGHLYLDGVLDKELYNHVDTDKIPKKYHKKVDFEVPIELILRAGKKLTKTERSNLKKLLLDPRLAPLAASNELLRKTPKTYLVTCDSDVLRDEGILFAEKLKSLNVEIEHVHVNEAPHGVAAFTGYFGFIKRNYLEAMKRNFET